LNKKNKKIIYDFIDKYGDIFAKNRYDVGTVRNHEAHIKLTSDKYISKKPYRCTFDDSKEIETQVKELLKHV